MKDPEISIAREGYPFILLSGFATLVLALLSLDAAALTGLVTTCFVTWFFRDPARVVPEETAALVAPADGKVIRIEEVDDGDFTQGRAVKVSIFMNIFNVHVNRIPRAGLVEHVTLKPGRFYSADSDKAVLHNEHCALRIRTDGDQRYAVVQVAGLIARRIICRAVQGDRVATGGRYGLIRFGSRVDLYLPPATPIHVRRGDKVRAGETILAHLP